MHACFCKISGSVHRVLNVLEDGNIFLSKLSVLRLVTPDSSSKMNVGNLWALEYPYALEIVCRRHFPVGKFKDSSGC